MASNDTALDRFVEQALAKGHTADEVRAALQHHGWGDDDIDRALKGWGGSAFGLAVPRPTPQTTARDWFLYATHFSALMAAAWAMTTIGFDFINWAMPDTALQSGRYSAEAARLPLAILIVAYPVFVWINQLLGRGGGSKTSKPPTPVRRWAVNGLLFISAMAMLIDLIALLYGFLKGDLSLQFVAKIGVVALVFGTIFARFYSAGADNADDETHQPPTLVTSNWPLHLLAVIAIAAGGYIVQSPAAARDERIDSLRSNHLQALDHAIACYAADRETLPESLQQIADSPRCGDGPYHDPVSGAPYPYRVMDDKTYELCAVFDTDNTDQMHIMVTPNYYRHKAGRVCFTNQLVPVVENKPHLKTLPANPVPQPQ